MFEAIGKALGIEIKPVQDVPQWIPETESQLLAITTPPGIPQQIWNVMGGGLDDHQLNLTNKRITDNAKLMRARLLHIRNAFKQLDLPLTYGTYEIALWLKAPKRAAEQSLLYRFQRSQSGGRNWETPNNPLPIDFDYKRDVALARGHMHSGTMWVALKAQAPPPSGQARYGYVLPITPQERALSIEASKVNFAELQLPLAQRAAAVHNPETIAYALYPHLATQARPGLSVTYIALADYVDKEAQKAYALANKQIGQQAIIAARAVASEWQQMAAAMRKKWGRGGASPLYKLDQEAQKDMGLSPMDQWMKTHQAQMDAWIATHPEVKGELAHAKKLIEPHRRWMNWYSGQPFTKTYSDGTRLDYLIAVEAGQPVQAQIACQQARAKSAQQAVQQGRTPNVWNNPC